MRRFNKKIKFLLLFIVISFVFIIIFGRDKFGDNNKKEANPPITIKNEGNVTISLDEYNKIDIGMEYNTVKDIIGGDCISTEIEYNYFCSGDFAGTSATFVFENDKLVSKSQIGLE